MPRYALLFALLWLCARTLHGYEGPAVRIVTTSGVSIQGTLANRWLQVTTAQGAPIQMPLQAISSINCDQGTLTVVDDNKVVATLKPGEKLDILTATGTVSVLPADVRSLDFFRGGLPARPVGVRTLLGEIPDGLIVRPENVLFGDAGEGFIAIAELSNRRKCVISNGQVGESFDEIRFLTRLSDGKTAAYNGIQDRSSPSGIRSSIVVGSWKSPDYPEIRWMGVQEDGKVAYKLGMDHESLKERLFLGKEEIGKEFKSIMKPTISPQGQLAYIGSDGASSFLVYGKKRVPSQSGGSVGDYRIAVDGTITCDVTIAGPKLGTSDRFIYHGGKLIPLPPLTSTPPVASHVTLGPEGKSYYYYLSSIGHHDRSKDSEQMVFNGAKGPLFQQISREGIAISPDGKTIAYVGIQGDKHYVVNGTKRSTKPVLLGAGRVFFFSPNGRSLAYATAGDSVAGHGTQHLVVDEKAGPDCTWIRDIYWSPDSKTVAYVQQSGSGFRMTVGDKVGEEFLDVGYPSFSPDGSLLAYTAVGKQGCCVHVGDQVGPAYDVVYRIMFAPDGKSLGYGARKGNQLWWQTHTFE